MDFQVTAGSATYLPKELINEVIDLIVEKTKVAKLIDNRGQFTRLKNEGTFPILDAADEDKVFLVESTADITTLAENSFNIMHPDLKPRELGTYFYLKRAHIKQYSELDLENLYKRKLSEAMGNQVEKICLAGTDGVGAATAAIRIADGIYTIASDAAKCAATKVTFTTNQTQHVLNAVIDGKEGLENYADEDYADDLYIFAGKTFYSGCKKNADKDIIGFDYGEVPELGLKRVPHLDGTPVITRSNISDANAVLVNIKGARAGIRDDVDLDIDWVGKRRAYLNIITYWFDFVWAYLNNSGTNEGLILLEKVAS